MSRVGVTYSSNAVPVFGGPNTTNRSTAVGSAMPAPGSGSALATVVSEERAEDRAGRCVGNNDTCGARAAKGTEWCVGHLRSRGEL